MSFRRAARPVLGVVCLDRPDTLLSVTAFHSTAGTSGNPCWWTINRQPLRAKKATYRIKLAQTDACELPVQFVLRHVGTREELKIEGRTNLCKTPHAVSMIRLKVVTPTVIVGESSNN